MRGGGERRMEEEAGKACLCGECVQKRFGVFFVVFFWVSCFFRVYSTYVELSISRYNGIFLVFLMFS